MKKSNAFIQTQSPLTTTVEDFWALIYDYNCSVLVTLDHIDGKTRVSTIQFNETK